MRMRDQYAELDRRELPMRTTVRIPTVRII